MQGVVVGGEGGGGGRGVTQFPPDVRTQEKGNNGGMGMRIGVMTGSKLRNSETLGQYLM